MIYEERLVWYLLPAKSLYLAKTKSGIILTCPALANRKASPFEESEATNQEDAKRLYRTAKNNNYNKIIISPITPKKGGQRDTIRY